MSKLTKLGSFARTVGTPFNPHPEIFSASSCCREDTPVGTTEIALLLMSKVLRLFKCSSTGGNELNEQSPMCKDSRNFKSVVFHSETPEDCRIHSAHEEH